MTAAPLMSLSLAGERIDLRADDPAWREALAWRYPAFSRPPYGSVAAELVLHSTGPAPADVASLLALRDEPAVGEGSDEELVRLGTSRYRVRVDLRRRRADVWGPRHVGVVDAALRVLLAMLLAEDGLLLHAALLESQGEAWICTGPSGSGKSTLAGLLPVQAACDELTALRYRNGRWTAWSLPFWRSRPATGTLQSVSLLRHGARDSLRALDAREATRRLAAEVRWPESIALAQRALGTLELLIGTVPVRELAFRPTPAVWELLRAPSAAA